MKKQNISLILGIIVLGLWLIPWLGLIIAIIGLILGVLEIRKNKTSILIIAILLNITGLILVAYNFTYRMEQNRVAAYNELNTDVFLENLDQYIIDLKYYEANVVDSIAEIEESLQKAKIVLVDITSQGASTEDKDLIAKTVVSLEDYKIAVTNIGIHIGTKIKEFESDREQYLTGLISPEDINLKVTKMEEDMMSVNKDYLSKSKDLTDLQKSFEERFGQ